LAIVSWGIALQQRERCRVTRTAAICLFALYVGLELLMV
jgi:hypothetical protein